jgi:hypothetical protein
MPSIPRDNGENETGKDVEGSLAALHQLTSRNSSGDFRMAATISAMQLRCD